MNATITYTLTERAQRAQMAATGQPVARKQTVTVDLPADLIAHQIVKVSPDGIASVDLTARTGYQRDGTISWEGYSNWGSVGGDIPDANLDAVELVRTRIAEAEAASAETIRKNTEADKEAKAKRQAEIEQLTSIVAAFLADPTARGTYRDNLYIANRQIGSDVPGYADAVAAVQSRAQADKAEAERLKAEKDAAESVKEKSKLDFLRGGIAEHGSDSQRARSADGLLCRNEAIRAMEDVTFAAVNGVVYTKDSRPSCDCSNECCEECEVTHSVNDGVDCLTESEFAGLTAIKTSVAGATFVLRTHRAVHDCEHDDCRTGDNRAVMVKIPVGPFLLQREYCL
jgi:hypothetical protein